MLEFFTMLLAVYCAVTYIIGLIIFLHELPLNPKSLRPFGILVLIFSPIVAPHGGVYYLRKLLAEKKDRQ